MQNDSQRSIGTQKSLEYMQIKGVDYQLCSQQVLWVYRDKNGLTPATIFP